jgi:hypothetical protein
MLALATGLTDIVRYVTGPFPAQLCHIQVPML